MKEYCDRWYFGIVSEALEKIKNGDVVRRGMMRMCFFIMPMRTDTGFISTKGIGRRLGLSFFSCIRAKKAVSWDGEVKLELEVIN